jgi:hypothetical protein
LFWPVASQRQKLRFTHSDSMIWLVASRVHVYIVKRVVQNSGKDLINTNKG